MQPVLTVLKGSDARRRYKPPARPYHLFYYTGFVNTFTENGRTFYTYPPLRGASFHRKEGMTTRAPSLGRGCRAQRGGVGFLFLRRSRLLFAFPTRGRGTAQRWIGCSRKRRTCDDRLPLSFIPLERYPTRSARHLSHAGKALIQKYHFPHPTSAFPSRLCFGYSRILVSQPSPLGKGDRVSGG